MQKRIEELRVLNNWDATDMSFVQAALDEPLPIGLHKMGEFLDLPNPKCCG